MNGNKDKIGKMNRIEVYTGTKSCGCLVAVMSKELRADYINQTLKEWEREGLKIKLMDLEEACNKLKRCNCKTEEAGK